MINRYRDFHWKFLAIAAQPPNGLPVSALATCYAGLAKDCHFRQMRKPEAFRHQETEVLLPQLAVRITEHFVGSGIVEDNSPVFVGRQYGVHGRIQHPLKALLDFVQFLFGVLAFRDVLNDAGSLSHTPFIISFRLGGDTYPAQSPIDATDSALEVQGGTMGHELAEMVRGVATVLRNHVLQECLVGPMSGVVGIAENTIVLQRTAGGLGMNVHAPAAGVTDPLRVVELGFTVEQGRFGLPAPGLALKTRQRETDVGGDFKEQIAREAVKNEGVARIDVE